MDGCQNGWSQVRKGGSPMPGVPPWSSRFRHFDNDRFDHVKHIQHGRDKISAQLVGQHAAILHLEVFLTVERGSTLSPFYGEHPWGDCSRRTTMDGITLSWLL